MSKDILKLRKMVKAEIKDSGDNYVNTCNAAYKHVLRMITRLKAKEISNKG